MSDDLEQQVIDFLDGRGGVTLPTIVGGLLDPVEVCDECGHPLNESERFDQLSAVHSAVRSLHNRGVLTLSVDGYSLEEDNDR